MRLLVCGGRDFQDSPKVFQLICDELDWHDVALDCPHTIISGAARGVDTLAYNWAETYGVPIEEYPADWEKYGKGAGHIRNQQMLDEGKPDKVLAIQGGKGTADMVRRARKANIPVQEVRF